LLKFRAQDGGDLQAGDLLIQPDLAQVLRTIAEEGEDGFYRGRVASLIVDEMEKGGGLITLEDLHDYRAVIREPVVGDYRGYEVISAPPPSSGGIVLLEILNMLEASAFTAQTQRSSFAVHLMIEAEKRAYHDRAVLLGDPDYVEIPVSRLISKEYARESARSIGDSPTPSGEIGDAGAIPIESEETTHYSIIDRDGNAVAVTTTLNDSFGNRVVVTGGGFLLNNEMDDFSSKPGVPNIYGLIGGEANAIASGKRMLSSMTPTIVLKDDRPFLILGSPGGSTIITTVAQIIVNMIDFGMKAPEAVSASRYHHQWVPDIVYYEEGIGDPGIISALEGMGHKVEKRSPIGDAQVIAIDRNGRCGVSDPRHGGRSKGTKDAE
ncbi:MAG TPA: gamma-glutamyltransferase, partial [Candidatus Krumholzibacterium sp.]|nr:gamma-glutamyltransferase [Candidatus Krumholzibacterium sp.]